MVKRKASSPGRNEHQKQSRNQDDELRAATTDKIVKCPYLDTINRSILDFDFQKLCSVSLSDQSVYACLVCGKYFQGRGKNSHACTHALQANHYVFIHLKTEKIYCLPDNYEIFDSSLHDIRHALNPRYSRKDIVALESFFVGATRYSSRSLDGQSFLAGAVGLNNIQSNDYINVILQVIAHIQPIRDFFLDLDNYTLYDETLENSASAPSSLITTFGELIRKMWNVKSFKGHVSPHEFLQAIDDCSKKRFSSSAQSGAIDFLSWFLNELHKQMEKCLPFTKNYRKLGGKIASPIFSSFQGQLMVTSRKLLPTEEEIRIAKEDGKDISGFTGQEEEFKAVSRHLPYLFLTLELPPPPLFVNETETNIIPQVPLLDILAKYDGVSETLYKTHRDSHKKKYSLMSLPPFLIFHVKRLTKNNFFVEKNPTIVNFPIMNLDLSDFLCVSPEDRKNDAGDSVSCKYDLLANVVHDGKPEDGRGTYRVHIKHSFTGKWFEIQDLNVKEILPQMMPLTETYLQIWKRKKVC